MDQDIPRPGLRTTALSYGFISALSALRKATITGWDEPWHFRYVGKEAAKYHNGRTISAWNSS